jgi:hypothetical protein
MTDPLPFDTRTPRFELPLLFAGQSQKEFFVNEALLRSDLLLHCTVEGETNVPPASPVAGQAWLVGGGPEGAFADHSGAIAGWTDAGWRFVEARDGMRVFDKALGCVRLHAGGWRHAVRPATPSGGSVVDNEGRAALGDLVDALVSAGLIRAS